MSVAGHPMGSTVPAGGAYANVPGTDAVALNCVAPSAIPYEIGAGLLQLIDGVVLFSTVSVVGSSGPKVSR